VTETRDDTVTWLTQEAYDRLKAELDHLSGPAHRYSEEDRSCRDEGDLKENGATTRQGRAGQIEADHHRPAHPGKRQGGRAAADRWRGRPGMTVTIRFVKDDDE